MHDVLVQTIRYKLQKRVRRLNSAKSEQFPRLLSLFFQFLDRSALLAGVRDDLLARLDVSDLNTKATGIMNLESIYGGSEEEAAALGYQVLKKLADDPDPDTKLAHIGDRYGAYGDGNAHLDLLREIFLEPFYEYIDEHLDDQQAILYFLRRYKHRCEWFHADRLRRAVEAGTQRGEKTLAYDLYEYLHDQGIDLHIEPHSASGIADLVAEQVGRDRVIADTKLFWPEKSKGKTYIASGFRQVYDYACDFNEPCAYLVIYKMSGETLKFLVPASEASFPCLTVNNKTIFFVVVDIYEHGASASKRGPMKSLDITEKDLVQSVENRDDSAPGTDDLPA